jgi:ParB-like chromosome segregation protein Spo0J
MSVALSSTLTIDQIPIDQLRPDPANLRQISDEELDALERSIRQLGFVRPVLAHKEDGVVIGGHERLVAA